MRTRHPRSSCGLAANRSLLHAGVDHASPPKTQARIASHHQSHHKPAHEIPPGLVAARSRRRCNGPLFDHQEHFAPYRITTHNIPAQHTSTGDHARPSCREVSVAACSKFMPPSPSTVFPAVVRQAHIASQRPQHETSAPEIKPHGLVAAKSPSCWMFELHGLVAEQLHSFNTEFSPTAASIDDTGTREIKPGPAAARSLPCAMPESHGLVAERTQPCTIDFPVHCDHRQHQHLAFPPSYDTFSAITGHHTSTAPGSHSFHFPIAPMIRRRQQLTTPIQHQYFSSYPAKSRPSPE